MDKTIKEDISFKDQKIVDILMDKEVQKSFLEYSMSVIVSRALPDVRDGMKPVHRRILYAMYEDHLTHDNPFRKSSTTVGNVLGRYHPHGDVAVYYAMVRLAQPFSLRYPLVEGHGNFGNVDGDGAAAYRYTEARMARMADEMLSDIDKEVIDFDPNFDNTRREPQVLPARFPNLLVNGCVGIAVGMATNVPPHNLGEVIDGTICLMDNPDADVRELMTYIKGPDFPTYATIYGTSGIYQAYMTGKGHINVRAKADVDEEKRRITVTEIPYQVNKSMLVESIANLVKDKKVDGITAIRDESGRHGMKIVIEFRRDTNGHILLNQLYKYTQLQDTCAVNMVALVNGEPKTLGLKEILTHYIKHQENIIERRTKFDLDKAQKKAHIWEGYKIAIDNIDAVIKIIRASKSIPDAKLELMTTFSLDDVQAQAIVDMPLGKLSNLETLKIEDELDRLHKLITELQAILADEGRIKQIIKDEMLEIKRKYSDDRRTIIEEAEDEIILEDLIERHSCIITLTNSGYIKRQRADVYTAQRRGGKGIVGMKTKEEDFVIKVVSANSHSFLMLFTNTGKVFAKKAYQIPEASRTSKGSNVVNILELQPGEKVTSVVSVNDFNDGYLLMVTKNGIIKKTAIKEYENQRKGGKIALTLDDNDELLFVHHTKGTVNIIVATHDGNAVCFDENTIRPIGRTSRGVRAIKLCEGDFVCGVAIVDENKQLITITENGFGKRSEFSEYNVHNRGGKGVCCHKLSDKTGKLAGISSVDDNDDLMIVTTEGTIIRTPVCGIPTYSRSAGGVIVMRLSDGAKIYNFAKVDSVSDEEIVKSEAEEQEIARSEVSTADNVIETTATEDDDI